MPTAFCGGDKSANKAGKFIERLISYNTELSIAIPSNLNTYFYKFSTIEL